MAVDGDTVFVDVQTVLQRRGGTKQMTRPDGSPAVQHTKVDRTLLRALVRAETWKRDLLSGEVRMLQDIASAEGVQVSYAQRVLRLAFLRPSLKKAILDGRTPPWLTLQRLMERGVALDWAAQSAALMD
ncbi:hypothetical protein [Phenylobacterium sp.]|uniref:hypothetical protein n=1 Tax=Phenylobacterium sp. TaxID=1871053 RepID=UPI00301C065B